LAGMQQGQVVVGMLRTIGVPRWLQQARDCTHPPGLLPPRCEYGHANKRQRRRDTDESPLRLTFFLTGSSAWPPLPSLEPPGLPQPLDVTESDRHLLRRFRDRMPYQVAWTGGIGVEEFPQQGLVSCRDLASSTPGWTRRVIWVALRKSEG